MTKLDVYRERNTGTPLLSMRTLRISDLRGLVMGPPEITISSNHPIWIAVSSVMLPNFGKRPGSLRRLSSQRKCLKSWQRTLLVEVHRRTFYDNRGMTNE